MKFLVVAAVFFGEGAGDDEEEGEDLNMEGFGRTFELCAVIVVGWCNDPLAGSRATFCAKDRDDEDDIDVIGRLESNTPLWAAHTPTAEGSTPPASSLAFTATLPSSRHKTCCSTPILPFFPAIPGGHSLATTTGSLVNKTV